jgi:hypothetical protein
MHPDKLEKFILENRESFDHLDPDPRLWEGIHKKKAPILRIKWKDVAWRAAAVVIIFISSYYFHDYMANRKEAREQKVFSTNEKENNPMMQNLMEAEAFYTSQINFKKEEVFKLAGGNPQVNSEINTEFVELDKVFEELKKDLKDNADNEEVIEAMIQNYRIKLEILEDMLSQLKQVNDNDNNSKDEQKRAKI